MGKEISENMKNLERYRAIGKLCELGGGLAKAQGSKVYIGEKELEIQYEKKREPGVMFSEQTKTTRGFWWGG